MRIINGSGGRSHADLAWQVIAGSDYYWTPKFSTFIEYHYLDYTSSTKSIRVKPAIWASI